MRGPMSAGLRPARLTHTLTVLPAAAPACYGRGLH